MICFEFWLEGTVITKIAAHSKALSNWGALCSHTQGTWRNQNFVNAIDELDAFRVIQKWLEAGAPRDVGWDYSSGQPLD